MKNTLIAAALLVSATAAADVKLATQTYTATPNGFLVTSTLISGDKEAVLVDAQFTLADAHRLVAQILESKKTLTTVIVTHSHPDHYFGLEVIKQAFPNVKIVTSQSSHDNIAKTAAGKVKQWGPMYGAQITTKPITPAAQKVDKIVLEGQTIEIHANAQGDSPDNTYVWIPSIKTLITGDIAFAGVHVWTAEGDAAARTKWEKQLDDLIALAPTTVIAGHRDPSKVKAEDVSVLKWTKEYLQAFDAAVAGSTNPADVQTKIKAKYKDLSLDVILQIGATAQYPDKAAPAKK